MNEETKVKENKKDNKKKPSVVKIVLLSILAVILIAITVFLFMYGDKLYIMYRARTTSEEDRIALQKKNDEDTNKLLHSLTPSPMRDLTDEERELLNSGTLTKEEALALIRGEIPILPPSSDEAPSTEPTTPDASTAETASIDTTSQSDGDTQPAETSVTTQTSATEVTTTAPVVTTAPPQYKRDPKVQQQIDDIIAEIYLLRATYLNKIENLIASTKAEYVALPKDQHNLSGKMRVIERMIPKGEALEAACDAEMEVLLGRLKNILVAHGEDTSIIQEIRNAYTQQKELKQMELYGQYSHHLS